MSTQHLSDEAVAAFADGVLTGHARERATRHAASCAECADAVQVQREAAWALRVAPAPALPSGLLDRLRGLPEVTPISTVPTVTAPDGSMMFSTMASTMAPVAAFAPTSRPSRSASRPGQGRSDHRSRAFVTTAAVVALAGALTAGSVAARDEPSTHTGTAPGNRHVVDPGAPHDIAPATVFTNVHLFGTGEN
ncbi:MAG: anti-sigma factor family protein [Jatrophihabitans sp.]